MELHTLADRLGGTATRRRLLRSGSRRDLEAAVREGRLIRVARGRYASAHASELVRRAASVHGIVSHRSAAQHWGWAQKQVPDRVEVTVPRTRHLRRQVRRWIIPHWSDLRPEHVLGQVTTRERTLVDCMRNLPWDEALAIVDSALRCGDITKRELLALADDTRGRGRSRIRGVAAAATHRAANPFESVLRAQALLIPGLSVLAQVTTHGGGPDGTVRPDLVDSRLRIVVEAESFTWHGERAALTRDCRRYNTLTGSDWLVVRFSWRMVMREAAYVQRVLLRAVELAERHANVAAGARGHPV